MKGMYERVIYCIIRGNIMSCSIYYEGTLKEKHSIDDVFEIVSKHMENIEAEIEKSDNMIVIEFLDGYSENLFFYFINNKINDSFKWNGGDPEEFYRIYDMFIELKTLFKSFNVEDDDGIWHEYIAQKSPCKIKLRSLSPEEMKFLERIKINEMNSITELEQYVILKTRLFPYRISLLRIIVEDFIKIMNIKSIENFNPQSIVDLANEIRFFGKDHYEYEVRSFDFYFPKILMQIWISYYFEYKNLGIVKDVSDNLRGFGTSKIAALGGILSVFLNLHSGGSDNAKMAEMKKLARKYYNMGPLVDVIIMDEPERELEFFFSMIEYLGLKYIGIN